MKLILKLFGAVIVLAIISLLILLVPPHWQVRSVVPPLPDAATLRSLLSAENGPVQVSYLNTSSQRLPTGGTLGHPAILIEWANGDILMIDAGMDVQAALEFSEIPETLLGAESAVIHGTITELLGEAIQRVQAVAFTHLHIDHTQGIQNFCAARGPGAVRIQTTYQQELHNFNTEQGAEIVANACLELMSVEGDKLATLPRFPGVGIFPLGGHTPGSTLFAVGLQDHLLLFSGDTTNTKAEILENKDKGFLYSYLLVPENTARTAELRHWLRELDARDDMTVVVAHDLDEMKTVLPVFTGKPARELQVSDVPEEPPTNP